MKGRVRFSDGTECNLRFTFRHTQACTEGKLVAHCTTAEFAVILVKIGLQLHSIFRSFILLILTAKWEFNCTGALEVREKRIGTAERKQIDLKNNLAKAH